MGVTIGEQQMWGNIHSIAQSLNSIRGCLEYFVQVDRQRTADVDPESIGALALWRAEVFAGRTLLSFTDWLAWHNAEKNADPDRTKDLGGEPT